MTLPNEEYLNTFVCDDVLNILPKLANNSVDVVVTDPPYFLDRLDNNWNVSKVANQDNLQVIKSLPAGMKYDKEQGKRFYAWYLKVSQALFRVLKPGGYFFSFSSPRLFHRMTQAIDDAGFDIRDGFIWLYTQNQPKAMSLNHFIDRMDISDEDRDEIKSKLNGWKTPQVKSCFEPICMAQKTVDGTYLQNMLEHEVGLVNTNIRIGDSMFPANVITTELIEERIDRAFLVAKPDKREKGYFNEHKTVKPVSLFEYLIRLTVFSDKGVVLDPFMGSGTAAVAATRLGVNFIGIDINEEYLEIARKRLNLAALGGMQEEGFNGSQSLILFDQKQASIPASTGRN